MTQRNRRGRSRVDTDRDIRQHARELLAAHGHEAVTLRAIARGLGITAPALYRYYDSRAALLEQLRDDVSADLSEEMSTQLATVPEEETVQQVRTACRTFRSWSLDHPREFVLFFASLVDDLDLGASGAAERAAPANHAADPKAGSRHSDRFGQIFLTVAGRVLATHHIAALPDEQVPAELRADFSAFREGLLATIAATGVELPDDAISLGTAYQISQFWIRLYGHVALEVFGRFPTAISAPGALFEATLSSLMRDVGLTL